MKITRLTTYLVPPRWCFLKIETDEGITGWGEPVLEGRAHTVATAVSELADYLVGKDPSLIEEHWTVMYRAGFYRGGRVPDPEQRARVNPDLRVAGPEGSPFLQRKIAGRLSQ